MPHKETEEMRKKLASMPPADRAKMARDTEDEMRGRKRQAPGETKGSDGHGGYLATVDGKGKLPIKKNGKISNRLIGDAEAALSPDGFRGHEVQLPPAKKAVAKRKLATIKSERGMK